MFKKRHSRSLIRLNPNKEYENHLKKTRTEEVMSGKELALCIVKNDDLTMYNSYSIVNNEKMQSFSLLLKEYFKLL